LKFLREFHRVRDVWYETGVLSVRDGDQTGRIVETPARDYTLGQRTTVMTSYGDWKYEEIVGEEATLYALIATGIQEVE